MSTRIKILEQVSVPTVSEPMPLEHVRRWVSPYEHRVVSQLEIFFRQSAYLNCLAQATRDLKNEVGGVLIGEVRTDPERAQSYILIEDTLPAQHVEQGSTHVTFTQDTLVQLNNELEDNFPGKRMVGWYHTHPRLNVFLSNYDSWLHTHFFNDPAQVALVIDPYYQRAGFFVWQDDHRLDTVHYVGFYELLNGSGKSFVELTNLTPLDDVTTS